MSKLIPTAAMAFSVIILGSCSLRRYLPHRSLYHPPALGAEHVIDAGLRPEKKPSTLFSASMTKYLQDRGVAGRSSGKKSGAAPAAAPSRPAAPAPKPAAADSGFHGNFTTPAHSK
jgi:hypothetical protein